MSKYYRVIDHNGGDHYFIYFNEQEAPRLSELYPIYVKEKKLRNSRYFNSEDFCSWLIYRAHLISLFNNGDLPRETEELLLPF